MVQALGFVLDGERGEVRPIEAKREKLRSTLLWLSTRPRVSGKAVERVIGHCIHMFMLRRELLSIFRLVYGSRLLTIQTSLSIYRLWKFAAQEFQWAAALLLVCYSDLRKPWNPQATVSDACLSGTAVAALQCSPDVVQAVGQCREMWRFKSQDP